MTRSLAGLDRAALGEALGEIGVPERERKMRVSQLWHWIYFRGVRDFDAMTNVSKDLRAKLKEHFTLERPEVVVEQVSSDGTRKWLIRLPADTPGEAPHDVEAVYIPESDRGTLCISSRSAAR
jgi:23S rRNA (adenine2503-C2)-methyltransferase